MKRAIIAAASVAAIHAASPAWAHSEPPKSGTAATQPQIAPLSAKEGAGGTRDPRAYFTDLELLTQEGRKVRFYSDVLEGRTVMINVIYTNCKDACPMLTQQLNEVRKLIPDLFGKKVFFVSLSSDPTRDTPQLLKQFAREQGVDVDGWIFLTGPKQNIDHVLKKLGQYSDTVEGHSTLFIAGNVAAKRWSKIRPDAPAAAIAERLNVLASSGGAAGAKP